MREFSIPNRFIDLKPDEKEPIIRLKDKDTKVDREVGLNLYLDPSEGYQTKPK